MKDPRLVKLNFQDLLDYDGQPTVRFEYKPPIPCKGYCVDCEKKEILKKTGMRLDRMSHGCDSSDYEVMLLGPIPTEGPPVKQVKQPILFLLENPGGACEIDEEVTFDGFRKRPPVRHYYWIPHLDSWPRCVGRDRYNSYFAYLMWKHQVTNVYITNLVKCKEVEDNAENPPDRKEWKRGVVQNCTGRYLARELKFYKPRIVFCFGWNAKGGLEELLGRKPELEELLRGDDKKLIRTYLYHPAARLPLEKVWRQNDEWIAEALRGLA
jgi:hypothetical protein